MNVSFPNFRPSKAAFCEYRLAATTKHQLVGPQEVIASSVNRHVAAACVTDDAVPSCALFFQLPVIFCR